MNEYEFNTEIKKLQKKHIKEIRELYKKYAFSNNPYKIDDVISDHIGSIKIEEISVCIINGIPSCVYYGVELKKDGTPKKGQKYRTVYQVNIIR